MARRRSSLGSNKGEELINNYGAIRLRVTGSANLQMNLFSLDEVQNFTMLPVPITPTTNIQPTRLCNFTQQRAKLQIKTTTFGETFQISKIIVFVRPVAKNYPD